VHTDDVSGVLVALGAAVANTAFKVWTGDNALADNVSDKLTDLLADRISDARDRQKVANRFASIAEIVGDRVAVTTREEFRGLDAGEKNAAVIAVTETLERADLSDIATAGKVVVAASLDAATLERFVRRHAQEATKYLSADGTAFYELVLSQCCASIAEIADKLPGFQGDAFATLLNNDRKILERIEEVLTRLPMPSREAAGSDHVEVDYRRVLAKDFDRLQLFGLDFASQWYPLSIAYVSLTMAARQGLALSAADGKFAKVLRAPDGEVSTGREWSFEQWLDACPRLLIEGRAGSGKTTILQWIAVRAALGDFTGPAVAYNGSIPFFVRLRNYAGRPMPRPEEFLDSAAPVLAGEAGTWPNRQLRSGRAFVLVDGIDEIPEAQRPEVLEWLRQLTELFPNVRCVATTRPSALRPNALADTDFVTADLEPMSPALMRVFIDRWHAAMRESLRDAPALDKLAACHADLARTLDDDRFLSELANTPLLAGLICALNHHLDGELPRRRGEVYAAALKMFHERDRKRRIASDLSLDLAATNHLLSDLALWMVRNARTEVGGSESGSLVTTESASAAIRQSALSLRNRPSADVDLYRHLLLRSGLLREPTAGHVDFVHRTFQEYLSALALIRTDSIGEILVKAVDSQWREVVILASGLGNMKQTSELLHGLLSPHRRKDLRYEHCLLAVACLDEIIDATPEVLSRVEQVIPELLPPRNVTQAEALSHAGDRLIPHLAAASRSCLDKDLEFVILAAALIGTPEALNLLAELAERWVDLNALEAGSRERAEVNAGLMRAWSYFDPELYAEKVIATLNACTVTTSDVRVLKGIAKSLTVEHVELTGLRMDFFDVAALDGVPVSEVTISNGLVKKLGGTLRHPSTIKHLTLRSCLTLKTIEAVAELKSLESLTFIDCRLAVGDALYWESDRLQVIGAPWLHYLAPLPRLAELRFGYFPIPSEQTTTLDQAIPRYGLAAHPPTRVVFLPNPSQPT
jgi:hypothetical protein